MCKVFLDVISTNLLFGNLFCKLLKNKNIPQQKQKLILLKLFSVNNIFALTQYDVIVFKKGETSKSIKQKIKMSKQHLYFL